MGGKEDAWRGSGTMSVQCPWEDVQLTLPAEEVNFVKMLRITISQDIEKAKVNYLSTETILSCPEIISGHQINNLY